MVATVDALNTFFMQHWRLARRAVSSCRYLGGILKKQNAGGKVVVPLAACSGLAWLLCGLAVLGLTDCHRGQEQVATYSAAAGQTAGWRICNASAGDISFSLRLNDGFWSNRRQLVEEIGGQSRDTQAFVVQAARWVHQHSRNIRPLSTDNWIHSPEVFMNSLGLGYCDDRASVLASLWEAYGLRARLWNLQGHVVPEVMVAGRWQLHDPDTGVCLLDDDKRRCSVADVAAGRARYYEMDGQRYPIGAVERILLHMDKYASRADNQLSDWYQASPLLPDSQFRLPAGTSIRCCSPSPLARNAYVLELRLPPASRGWLSIPLVLAAFPPSLSPQIPKADSLYGALPVVNQQRDTLSLLYYVNPYIVAGQQHNKLIIRGQKVDQLNVHWQVAQPHSPPRYLDDFRDYYLRNKKLDEWIGRLPKVGRFSQLPEVFRHYYQLQGVSAEEISLREQAFLLRFHRLLPVVESRPALARHFLQNTVYQILLFELCQTLDPQEVLPYLENLTL